MPDQAHAFLIAPDEAVVGGLDQGDVGVNATLQIGEGRGFVGERDVLRQQGGAQQKQANGDNSGVHR